MTVTPKFAGEPSTKALASGLATLGRYGDEYMVHAAEGETVIPREVLDANPALRMDLFRQMAMMGIADPNRYVVGNELNSLNPDTGQPEFFFKKIFKAVKKVFKAVAPVVVPILGNMIAPGIGGIVASGLMTKLQGGTWGDAAKSAALSYGVGALGQGIRGGFSKAGTFMGGLKEGLMSPINAGRNLFESGAANPLAQGIFGPKGLNMVFSGAGGESFAKQDVGLFPNYQTADNLQSQGFTTVTDGPEVLAPTDGTAVLNPGPVTDGTQSTQVTPAQRQLKAIKAFPNKGLKFNREGFQVPSPKSIAGTIDAQRNLEDIQQRLLQSPSASAADPAVTPAVTPADTTDASATDPAVPTEDWFERTFGKTGGNLARQSAVPLGIAALTYAMSDTPETPEDWYARNPTDPTRPAYTKWQTLSDKNSPEALALSDVWRGPANYSSTQLTNMFGANPISGLTRTAADGGEVIGRGTGTSDSIPARLSDGEFVMTAQAVRNAGGGNRDLGAARMYDMMRRFEGGMA